MTCTQVTANGTVSSLKAAAAATSHDSPAHRTHVERHVLIVRSGGVKQLTLTYSSTDTIVLVM